MKAHELRERFLGYFEGKGHTRHPSDSLVPQNDPSLLFTGAGMNQFKDMFMGSGRLPFTRATTVQKCLRTGDIERVGRTSGHHTFFEMLGNFSFGDYFKEEAISWGWEFLTQVLRISEELLSVSVYKDDHEAEDIWRKKIGIPAQKIFKFGESDNFWPANAPSEGPNGPCGPCSEIYYDFGPRYGCGSPSCTVGCNCSRFVEVWNLVFMQFERHPDGTLAPLPRKNIDTGMGLERLCAVMQGTQSNFHTDLFMPLISAVSELAKVKYESSTEQGARMRRIADHVRAVVFCLADGVVPSNEGRGYVERKILRIAVRDVIALGIDEGVLHKLVPMVIEIMKPQYGDLAGRSESISRIVRAEEEKFLSTVDQGMSILSKFIEKMESSKENVLSGDQVFLLYDTYGFPPEITASILAERGMQPDMKGFEKALEHQRKAARKQTKISSEIFESGPFHELTKKVAPTRFSGYDKTASPMKILALIKGEAFAESIAKGEEAILIADGSPFYGESGGQVGDTGTITAGDAKLAVTNTTRFEGYILHHVKVEEGTVRVNQPCDGLVDGERRIAIARNHTTTHILQSALRKVLGNHIEQSGSLVTHDRLRFDFTHYAALTREELLAVERFVNERIMANAPVSCAQMGIDEAKKSGALMFFSEKYGKDVRVVSVGDFSREFCGGTHLAMTGTAGSFKIISESSIASGVRRIEAVTGEGAFNFGRELQNMVEEVASLLSSGRQSVVERTKALLNELKEAKQELGKLRKGMAGNLVESLIANAKTIGGEKVAISSVEENRPDAVRSLVEALIKKGGVAAVLLYAETGGKQSFFIGLRDDMVKRGIDAGKIAKEIGAICGGGGGGRGGFAQAGGSDRMKIGNATKRFEEIIDNAPAKM